MQTTLSARRFTWLADEPHPGGGTDAGPVLGRGTGLYVVRKS